MFIGTNILAPAMSVHKSEHAQYSQSIAQSPLPASKGHLSVVGGNMSVFNTPISRPNNHSQMIFTMPHADYRPATFIDRTRDFITSIAKNGVALTRKFGGIQAFAERTYGSVAKPVQHSIDMTA